ncbi:MAG: methylenetetrahydrofolate reductase C-terminal domain-containing protein [Thermoleophilia bacterium]|nr:methylenetetrahydrofolate reductase C-terminal domain-containing protein [Thermoleophilia bacterium]
MITAERKNFEEIRRMTDGHRNILVAGCNTCVAVCLTGGEKEAERLAAQLRIARERDGIEGNVETVTVLRQCENEYLDSIGEEVGRADLVLSTACSIGPQGLVFRYPKKLVMPAMNTNTLGYVVRHHEWFDYCIACGDCIIGLTGGICPVARCAKKLLNGPCGGSQQGRCEVSADIPCVWQEIYDRLAAIGQLDTLRKIIGPKNWDASNSGGPRIMKKEGFKP